MAVHRNIKLNSSINKQRKMDFVIGFINKNINNNFIVIAYTN